MPLFANKAAQRKRQRVFSPITLRILAVNMIALGILVIGILYLGEYRRGLILSDVTSLETQGEMFAAALGEGASVQRGEAEKALVFTVARQMVRRLVQKGTRARLFALDGSLMADSGELPIQQAPREISESESLIERSLRYAQEFSSRIIFGEENLPLYIEPRIQRAQHFPEAISALQGDYAGRIRQLENASLIISVAVPVTREGHVLGALLLSKGSEDIERALFEVRLHIFKVFLISLAVTTMLSLYFAGTIARPLRILARAAHAMRTGMDQRVEIPDFHKRNDEIGDLSKAMRQMTDALWHRMDAIEHFAADVAHELKNPLTSLKSAVETASRVENPDAQKRLMEIIHHDISRLDRLISDISEASRVDAELSRAKAETVDLVALLQTLVALRTPPSKDKSAVALQIETGDLQTAEIEGIESRLGQVIQNLIDNAMTFSPEGSTVTLRLSHDPSGKDLILQVLDQGPGIPPGSEDKIFKRFYTERPDTEDFGNHSGLGLAIAKQIIEAHGASLTAQNITAEDGQVSGACFTIRFTQS